MPVRIRNPVLIVPVLMVPVLMVALFALSSPIHATCDSAPMVVDDEIDPPPQLLVLLDPLANDSDPQGLPLEVTVVSSTCPGNAVAEDGLVTLTLTSLIENPCQITYNANNGKTTPATATITIQQNAQIFSDGFEIGNTSAWSGS